MGTQRLSLRSRDPVWTWRSYGNPEVFGFAGTVLSLPGQDYYRYLFGSRILPLGSWPLSSSYLASCFCKKPLTDFGGSFVDLPGVVIQAPDFIAFHV